MGILTEFAIRFCGVDEEFLLRALLLSGNARGYILGAVTELLLKEELEKLGYELLRIREKWEGDKKHHGDYYVRKNGSPWFVLESKGVKSNSAKWHNISSVPTDPDRLNKWFSKKRSGEFYDWWHSLGSAKQIDIINNGRLIQNLGVKSKDALHVACAIEAKCDYFLSTDDFLLKKLSGFIKIKSLNPLSFLNILEESQ